MRLRSPSDGHDLDKLSRRARFFIVERTASLLAAGLATLDTGIDLSCTIRRTCFSSRPSIRHGAAEPVPYCTMSAVRGLALAARSSGKLKAWIQGVTLITVMAWPAVWWTRAPWHLTYAFWMTWICAAFSVASMIEYMWVNRAILAQLTPARSAAGQAA